MNNNYSTFTKPLNQARTLVLALCFAACISTPSAQAQNEPNSPAGGKSGSASAEVNQKIQENGQAALEKVQVLWQRIDERRLKNRTRDQIVAWVIVGFLAGGLLFRLGRGGQLTSIAYGLFGAFVGGILANVTQLNLGWGPVLITYEDLLFTLLGAVFMPLGIRWLVASRRNKSRVT